MTGQLALVGSGEFTPDMLDCDRFLLSQISRPNVAILPTAAGREDTFQKWIDDGVRHFTKLGASAHGIKIKNRSEASDPNILHQLRQFNFFYFSGGDPGYLLDSIKDTPAWQTIFSAYHNGATLAGSSAGAMVLGTKVWSRVYKFVEEGIIEPWEEGLKVVDFGILPHYDAIKRDLSTSWDEISSSLPDIPILGIDEDTACILFADNFKIMGRGKTHQVKLSKGVASLP